MFLVPACFFGSRYAYLSTHPVLSISPMCIHFARVARLHAQSAHQQPSVSTAPCACAALVTLRGSIVWRPQQAVATAGCVNAKTSALQAHYQCKPFNLELQRLPLVQLLLRLRLLRLLVMLCMLAARMLQRQVWVLRFLASSH